jgi:hypothetical protein
VENAVEAQSSGFLVRVASEHRGPRGVTWSRSIGECARQLGLGKDRPAS